MTTPVQKAINSAIKANDRIEEFFFRLGNKDNPRGIVSSSYRKTRRTLSAALEEDEPMSASIDVMSDLSASLIAEFALFYEEVALFAMDEASRQLRFYGIDPPDTPSDYMSDVIEAAILALVSIISQQDLQVRAMILSGAETDVIAGDEEDETAGVLTENMITLLAANWTASIVWAGFDRIVNPYADQLGKIAVAVLDRRTTDCCIRVHGQVQPLNAKFELTGLPRFADYMDAPPFHHRCRTSIALYNYSSGDVIEQMVMEASAELVSRE